MATEIIDLRQRRFYLTPSGGAIDPNDDNAPFIIKDGSINPNSLDGTGFARASSTFTDSIGFNNITPDKTDYVFAENVQIETILNHNRSTSGLVRQMSGGQIREYRGGATTSWWLVNSGANSFVDSWFYMDATSTWIGHGTTDETAIHLKKDGLNNQIVFKADAQNVGFISNDNLAHATTNADVRGGAAFGCHDAIINSGVRNAFHGGGEENAINSPARNTAILGGLRNVITHSQVAVLGGSDLVNSTNFSSDYALAENLEVQGGDLFLTAGDIEFNASANGVILKSPDNTRWRVTIDNSGSLISTSL